MEYHINLGGENLITQIPNCTILLRNPFGIYFSCYFLRERMNYLNKNYCIEFRKT